MELLRFTTAGSVDDGKSTLIGRLLYDSKSIFEDQLEAVQAASERAGDETVNLALLTDGLRAEREQGITIDVAYRYFATPRRKFIIADTPGHVEYTRNMVTGASTAEAAIILVDARHGVIEQTKRHSYIASLLQLPHIILAINKMDLVDFSQEVFEQIKADFSEVARKLNLRQVYYLPISARDGDNVVNHSERTPWYNGTTLLELLETLPVQQHLDELPARFPVQYVIRPQSTEFHDYRAYAGRVASGSFAVGQSVTVLPSGTSSTITAIDEATTSLQEAFSPQSVSIRLAHDVDVSRGDIIVPTDSLPQVGNRVSVMVCWLNAIPLNPSTKYIVRHAADEVLGIVAGVDYKVNIHTLEKETGVEAVKMNDIVRLTLKTSKPLKYDYYEENRVTGSLVFINPSTFETVGAGMIVRE